MYSGNPFFKRGGRLSGGQVSGIFSCSTSNGAAGSDGRGNGYDSFRTVLCARFIIVYLLKEIFKQLILCELIKQNNCKKIVLIFLKIKYKINNKE